MNMKTIAGDFLEITHQQDGVVISVMGITFPDISFESGTSVMHFQTNVLNLKDYVRFLWSEQSKILNKPIIINPIQNTIRTVKRGGCISVYVTDGFNKTYHKVTYSRAMYILKIIKPEMIKVGILTKK
jgi:hypothetical protein